MEIKKTIYFDKWGEWVAIEEKSEPETVDENAVPMDRLLIIKGKTHWHIDFIEKFATKQEAAAFSPGLTVFNNVTKRMTADDMEVKELETENHLDFDCKKNHIIYKSIEIEVTTLTYDNFTMKMTGKMENMDIEYEVISIDLTAPPASIFELPEGIEMRYRF
jgi:Uri superfamily endonuclease